MVGTSEHPLRVAIIGAGPAGFYAASHLLKQPDLHVAIDLFERLPTPFGLVRGGVAPDHQSIKRVTRVYAQTAAHQGVRYFGNVELGTHLHKADLLRHVHAVIYATGAQADRRLNIPGEDLAGSHSATEFVAWYNGHPDYRHLDFDLSQEHAVIVGVGNVAVDVARILCRSLDTLARTDIADYALEALRHRRLRTVTLLGRRGPAQAAFTVPEAKELGTLDGTAVWVPDAEATLDPLSAADLEAHPDRSTRRKVELIQGFAAPQPPTADRLLTIRFLVSPTAFLDDGQGHVQGVRIVRNTLERADGGRLRPRHTEATEVLPAGLVFRSVGYRGVPLDDVPFASTWGIIPNADGRVLDPATGHPLPGEYTAGWIKRGPSGVIGTNKSDAAETVDALLDDLRAGRLSTPETPAPDALDALVRARQPEVVDFADWQHLDRIETQRGAAQDRPRVKFTAVQEMLRVLDTADGDTADGNTADGGTDASEGEPGDATGGGG